MEEQAPWLCACLRRSSCQADATPLTDPLAAQIEMVYNNGGYIAQTQNEEYFNLWSDTEPADTLQTFRKPPGEL